MKFVLHMIIVLETSYSQFGNIRFYIIIIVVIVQYSGYVTGGTAVQYWRYSSTVLAVQQYNTGGTAVQYWRYSSTRIEYRVFKAAVYFKDNDESPQL